MEEHEDSLITISSQNQNIYLKIDPQRGLLMRSLQINGSEFIYINDENYRSDERPRCGCPILFPYIGALENDELNINGKKYPGNIHGIVHSNIWEIEKVEANKASFHCNSTKTNKLNFPYAFHLEATIKIIEKNIYYEMKIVNESTQLMPCDIGFHPFFKIYDLANVKMNVKAECYFDPLKNKYVSFNQIRMDLIKSSGMRLKNVEEIEIVEDNHSLTVRGIKNLHHVILWSGNENEFLCIEPCSGVPGAININENYFMMKPNESVKVEWTISIE